jgi:hypothetical protein
LNYRYRNLFSPNDFGQRSDQGEPQRVVCGIEAVAGKRDRAEHFGNGVPLVL